jgi:hypothetical protein
MKCSVVLSGQVRGRVLGAFFAGALMTLSASGRAETREAAPEASAPVAGAAIEVAAIEAPTSGVMPEEVAETPAALTLADLRQRHNRNLFDGLIGLQSKEAGNTLVVGDNTDPWGMSWTKCTNLGIHIMATLVAEQRGLVEGADALSDIRSIVEILGTLRTHRGIFPENIQIRGGIAGEVVDGRARFSSIDSAWVTL